MINACPNCGHWLSNELKDGLAHCTHCNRIFDSSEYNRLLSAGWLVRKHRQGIDQLRFQGIPEYEAILAYSFVGEYGYSHDEYQKVLKKLGVSQKAYIDYSA